MRQVIVNFNLRLLACASFDHNLCLLVNDLNWFKLCYKFSYHLPALAIPLKEKHTFKSCFRNQLPWYYKNGHVFFDEQLSDYNMGVREGKKLGGRKEICPTFLDCAHVVKKNFWRNFPKLLSTGGGGGGGGRGVITKNSY